MDTERGEELGPSMQPIHHTELINEQMDCRVAWKAVDYGLGNISLRLGTIDFVYLGELFNHERP